MFNTQLYKSPYHNIDLSTCSFLVTGGAGFIGSNLVEYLLKYNAGKVRVLDNLSNGYLDNIKEFLELPNFEFIEGDILDLETCKKAVKGIDYISHQAALGSVPRSILDPITTNHVNINGFLNILVAAKESPNLKKMVYAASSSTYGDSPTLPKVEGVEGKPLSPYAITKLVNELYADVFSRVYEFSSIGLRYFNVFGPKQNPNNPYAAVIPIFCKNFIDNSNLIINGIGDTSRDFTFIENVVQANIKSFFSKNTIKHEVVNIACGEETSLNKVVSILSILSNTNVNIKYNQERIGDVKRSLADISKAKKLIGYSPDYDFKQGLEVTYNWYKNILV
jgi:UDP-N-acetylglucosamine 4-epimerase